MLEHEPSPDDRDARISHVVADPWAKVFWALPALAALLVGTVLFSRMGRSTENDVTINAAPRTVSAPAPPAGIPRSETMPAVPSTPQMPRYATTGTAANPEPEVVITPDSSNALPRQQPRNVRQESTAQTPDPTGPYAGADSEIAPSVPRPERNDLGRSRTEPNSDRDFELAEREAVRRAQLDAERQAAQEREAPRVAAETERQRRRERQMRVASSEPRIRYERRERAGRSARAEYREMDDDLRRGRETRNRYRDFFNEQDFGDEREGRNRRDRY